MRSKISARKEQMSYSIKRYNPGDLVWSSEGKKEGVRAGVVVNPPDFDFNYEIAFSGCVHLVNEAFLHNTKSLAELYAKNHWQRISIETVIGH